jgi:halogenation protein CepH
MTSVESETFDVIVVGGGPAGSTLAALARMQGHRVLVLEKQFFPRYQIGESLLPSTVHGICRLIGVSDELAAAGFVRKRGGTFKWGTSPKPWTFSFSISPRIEGPSSYAYQVERSKFDHILLKNARRLGADVREGCAVTDVVADDERVRGVRYTDADGNDRVARGTFVVDASGNTSRLHARVGGRREYSDFFRSLALFGYYEGGKRLPPPNDGNILCVAFDSGWFWYIPLSSTLTSVGAVVRSDMAEKVQGDAEKAMTALIAECPIIAEYLSHATRVTTGQYGQIRVRKDYSYCQTTFSRPGMLLIGDAACFVDPVFSSGVHLATYGALLAARTINSVLAKRVDEESAKREFEARYRREYRLFYEFLLSFYEMHRDETSYFWQAKKVADSTRPEIEAFVELVAGISSGEWGLTSADRLVARLRSRSAELATAVDEVANSRDGNMAALFRASIVRDVMADGSQLQTLGLLGADAEAERPLFPGGLVPSLDGMFWLPSSGVPAETALDRVPTAPRSA